MSGSNSKMRTPHTLLSNPFNSLNSDTQRIGSTAWKVATYLLFCDTWLMSTYNAANAMIKLLLQRYFCHICQVWEQITYSNAAKLVNEEL